MCLRATRPSLALPLCRHLWPHPTCAPDVRELSGTRPVAPARLEDGARERPPKRGGGERLCRNLPRRELSVSSAQPENVIRCMSNHTASNRNNLGALRGGPISKKEAALSWASKRSSSQFQCVRSCQRTPKATPHHTTPHSHQVANCARMSSQSQGGCGKLRWRQTCVVALG